MRAILLAAALAGISTAAFAAGEKDAFLYLTGEQAFATVTKVDPAGNATSNPIINHDDFQEIVVQRTVTGRVETHDFYSDYMMVVDGNGTIAIGGAVRQNRKNPNGQPGEWLGTSSTGKVYDLKPGALVVIPKGCRTGCGCPGTASSATSLSSAKGEPAPRIGPRNAFRPGAGGFREAFFRRKKRRRPPAAPSF